MSVELNVFIEISSVNVLVGTLCGTDETDVQFCYTEDYVNNPSAKRISISLPLQDEPFTVSQTRNFFEGLLPEGYTRRCIAAEMRVAADDYIAILSNLGKECLGAIQIVDKKESEQYISYEKMSEDQLQMFAREGAMESAALVTKSHLSLTGASGKAGLYYNEDQKEWYLPLGSAPSTHIVKQSHVRLSKIVANEQLCLLTAKKLGISVPESFIIKFQDDADGNVLFATRRYDRQMKESKKKTEQGQVIPLRLHQEDFAQALGISSEKKYEKNNEHYLQKMMQLIQKYSADPLRDQMDLWKVVVFNYFVGNTDNHIKNSSLLYSEELGKLRLAPAYDIISTIIYKSSSDEMAIGINGKYNIYEISREDFEKEAQENGLGTGVFMKEYDKMKKHFPEALSAAAEDLRQIGFEETDSLSDNIKAKFTERISAEA